MKDFVFITDPHITSSSSVRTGDVLDDIIRKLKFVVDYCNEHNAVLLVGGDIFDKPTVPDYVKASVAEVLMKAKNDILMIPGNHSMLYGNPEFNDRTSYNVWKTHNLIKDLDSVDYIDYGDVVVTSQKPLKTIGKKQIMVFHGFLNKEDGRNSIFFDEINTMDNTLVLLGHDHVEYEPLKVSDQITVIRPGSFLRGIRADEHKRTPVLVHIKVAERLKYKTVPIDCRDWQEIFTTKTLKITKAQQSNTYDEIINKIRNSAAEDMTLESALQTVADVEVTEYILQLLTDIKLKKAF